MSVLNAIGGALAAIGSMTWQITSSLILGFTLSAIIQAEVHRPKVGVHRPSCTPLPWGASPDPVQQAHRSNGQKGLTSMSKGDLHTVKHGDGWANKVEGGKQVSNTAPTKAETQATGRDMAIDRGVEHAIHNKDGKIGERNTYPRSRDPRSSKG